MSMLGKIPWNKGIPCPISVRKKISNSLLGRVSPMKGKQGYWLGKKRPPFTEEWLNNMSEARKGNKGCNWKGGVTPSYRLIRLSGRYKLWRKSVFERDNYTCVWCGQIGGTLNADHIKSLAKHPHLIHEISNGRTLCIDCHKKTPDYAGRGRLKQL